MKKRKLTKVLALLLAMVMVFALPLEASAAAKVTASTSSKNLSKIRAVKRGKTTVTVVGGGKAKLTGGYIKFKAPATKTYKITLGNLHKYRRTSAQDLLVGSSGFVKQDLEGRNTMVTFKQNNSKKENILMIGSVKAVKYNSGKVKSTTPLKTRTAAVRLKKGETLYIFLTNIEGTPKKSCKLCYDLTIK